MTVPILPAKPAPPTPERVTMLCLGGKRHGQQIEVAADAVSWVDLLSAETYYVSEFKFVAHDPVNPRSLELRTGYVCNALVHEDIAPDPTMANQWWQALALVRLFTDYGRQVPWQQIIPKRLAAPPNGKAGQN